MGLDKILNIFNPKKEQAPAAASNNTAENAAKDKALNSQGRLNPMILTSAQGAQGPAEVGRKVLLGQ